jgi:hypothetical protein
MFDPDGRTWLKAFRFSLRVETQAQRIAVIIANNTTIISCPMGFVKHSTAGE